MSIKICHISDTHLRDFNPEPADILVHSGDALNSGSKTDLIEFRQQLVCIKDNYSDIVFVAGNHDWEFQHRPEESKAFLKELIPNIHVLQNESIELFGLKFYGSSDQPIFYDWAFNKSSHDLLHSYSNIPEDIDVLITHVPAKHTLDYVANRFNPNGANVGSQELAIHIPRLKQLKAHLFGHIHYSAGILVKDGIVHSNASICDEQYIPVNKANIIEL
jgi:Icc-related predicted phosphoesterase